MLWNSFQSWRETRIQARCQVFAFMIWHHALSFQQQSMSESDRCPHTLMPGTLKSRQSYGYLGFLSRFHYELSSEDIYPWLSPIESMFGAGTWNLHTPLSSSLSFSRDICPIFDDRLVDFRLLFSHHERRRDQIS